MGGRFFGFPRSGVPHSGYLLVVLCLLAGATAPAADVNILWLEDQPLPVIDGAIDPVWSLATKQFMTITIVGSAPTDPADCSGSWQALYDSQYLYVLIDVNDSKLYNDTALANSWQDDSVEFYVDSNNSKGGSTDENDFQYRFGWNVQSPNADLYEYFHRPGSLVGVEYMMGQKGDGYRLEIRIPWSTILGKPGAPVGRLIGVDCFINDDDTGGDTRESQVAWHATAGSGWNTPSMWGTALLVPGLKASNPTPYDGCEDVKTQLLQWVAGRTAAFHDVYFGTNPTPGADQFKGRQAQTTYYHSAGFTPGTTYYWRIDEVEADGITIHKGDIWGFTIAPLTAWKPSLADGAEDVPLDVKLSWKAGQGAILQHSYLGKNFNDVDQGSPNTEQNLMVETTYKPKALVPETTYFWRVDQFDGITWRKGPIWSFSTVAPGTGKILRQWWMGIGGTSVGDLKNNPRYPGSPDGWEYITTFEGPVDWANSYGSRLSGWLFVPASGDYVFWVCGDDETQLWLSTDEKPDNTLMIASVPGWTNPREWTKYPEQKSQPQSLTKGKRYYIEALMKEGTGGDNIAVAWQGPISATREIISANYVGPTPIVPQKAYAPIPTAGAADVTRTPTLRWSAGEKAAKHDVYFGTDAKAVLNATTASTGIYRGQKNLDDTSYTPTEVPLQWNKTYYWRIDEVNAVHPDSPWKGAVWSFTTTNHIMVDDFEGYTDDIGSRIFQTWRDGLGFSQPAPGYPGNGTGSAVGNSQPPYAEQTIVHGGSQSMPLAYDNSGAAGKARYSETQREWAAPQDWTQGDVKALSLWFYGDPDNAPEGLYVAVEDSAGRVKAVNHPQLDAVQKDAWQEWNIELTQFSAAGVNLAAVKRMYIGLGNRNSPKAGGKGSLYFDDIRLYRRRCVAPKGPSADLSDNCVVDYADLEIMASEWLDSGAGLAADLNADNVVDLKDYAILTDAWLQQILWP